ncbi:MAG: hypothetical protein ABI136_00880 [Ginsengibacter sp.]
MKINYLLSLGAIVVFSSCSTAYRSGQTPDDVYYSPAPQQNTYVTKVSDQDKDSYYYRNNEEDYNIRRGIDNPVYRSPLSLSMGFGYSPYSFSPFNSMYGYNSFGYSPYNNFGYNPYGMKGLYDPYYGGFGNNNLSFYSPYNSFYSPYSMGYGYSPFGYGYGYSPLYSPIHFSSKPINTNTGARRYNLGAYNNNSALGGERGNVQPVRNNATGVTTESPTGVGRVIRRVFTPTERNTNTQPANTSRREVRRSNNRSTYYNNNTERRTNNNNETRNNTYEAPTRTYTPSTPSNSSSSPSSSGSGSGSAPVRTFRR